MGCELHSRRPALACLTPTQTSLDASRILLLFDPEYLSAANFRKRYLISLRRSGGVDDEYRKAAFRELTFINSILTSPLHRQSKSPTLWHHRLWLLSLLLSLDTVDKSKDHFFTFVRAELDVVFKSGERHPKNYYAWQYARRLMIKVQTSHGIDASHEWEPVLQTFLSTCATLVQGWCDKHPSDISGWTFLLFLLSIVQSVPRRFEIVQQTMEYTINLRLKHESIWVFLRTALAGTLLHTKRDVIKCMLQKYQKEREGKDEDMEIREHVKDTIEWVEKYQLPLDKPLNAT